MKPDQYVIKARFDYPCNSTEPKRRQYTGTSTSQFQN